mgnify:CR=1 FL=1
MATSDLGRSYAVHGGKERMASHIKHVSFFAAAVAVFVCATLLAAQSVLALDISFRSFSNWAAIGPPADEYAAKLLSLSTTTLGKAGEVKFTKYAPTPAIPKEFKNIVAAVGAGGPLAGGTGFAAA